MYWCFFWSSLPTESVLCVMLIKIRKKKRKSKMSHYRQFHAWNLKHPPESLWCRRESWRCNGLQTFSCGWRQLRQPPPYPMWNSVKIARWSSRRCHTYQGPCSHRLLKPCKPTGPRNTIRIYSRNFFFIWWKMHFIYVIVSVSVKDK